MSAAAPAPAPTPLKVTPTSPRTSDGPFATRWRTHACGELTKEEVGEEVRLCGAVDKVIDARTFLLRDGTGRILVKLSPGAIPDEFPPENVEMQPGQVIPAEARKPRPLELESIHTIEGKVVARAKPDPSLPTGEVEIAASRSVLLSETTKDPLFDAYANVTRENKIRHRYLYLRRPEVQTRFSYRTQLLHEARRFLIGEAFEEIETPLLANRWTPAQREPFLAVREPRRVFALSGRSPVFGLAAMSAGLDRTFEIGRRFQKKKSYNPWQQPEFTVLELNMAWVEERDLFAALDRLLLHLWLHGRRETLEVPVRTLSFEEAWVKFGTDAPDARGGMEIQDFTRFAEKAGNLDFRDIGVRGGAIRALRAQGGAKGIPAAELEALSKLARAEPSGATLHWFGVDANGVVEAAGGTGVLEGAVADEIARALGPTPGDLVIAVVGWDRMAAGALAGKARAAAQKALGLLDPKALALVRVNQLPFHRHDPKSRGWKLVGDPMTRPVAGDEEGNPYQMRQQAFYLSVNGINVGGGCIRHHDRTEALRCFDALKLDTLEVDASYRQHMAILDHGAPPSGRASIGVERLLALMLGLDGIDELIAIPKMPDGTCPLTRSPWPIENHIVRALLGV